MSHIKRIINKDLKMVRDLKLEDQGIYLHYDDNDIFNIKNEINIPTKYKCKIHDYAIWNPLIKSIFIKRASY